MAKPAKPANLLIAVLSGVLHYPKIGDSGHQISYKQGSFRKCLNRFYFWALFLKTNDNDRSVP